MNDIEAAITNIINTFDSLEYPLDFLKKYVQLECLACGHGTETFLIKQKNSEQLYVAKCYDKTFYPFVHESDILKSLSHSGLPEFVDEFHNDRMICIVREYITGESLDQYIIEKSLTKKEVIEICVQLCDILIYLHGQQNPVIHRDIKPQNIIVKPDGKINLIDFDISRVYHTDAKTDTQFLGTREFAPPEQYGFSQTDCRTDIYSLGVVMGWLLTGETSTKEVLGKMDRDRIANVYKKCTAFSPENRFVSAAKLKAALIHEDRKHNKTIISWMLAILTSMIFLCIGFFIGRCTNFLSDALNSYASITFEEPMIEQAVRLQLGKTANEIITENDLISVTGLYIFGNSIIAKTEEELHTRAKHFFENNQMKVGHIRSLNDLTKMPNLKQIFISMQEITDISPLATLVNLEVVDIKNNPIIDISPLGELKFLKRVCLFDTRVTDLSPLTNCPMLFELNAGKLPIRTPAAFNGLEKLQNLSLYETTIDTLAGIENLTYLKFFEVTVIADGNLAPLLSLQHLENVVLGEDMRYEAENIGNNKMFSISYR